ETATVQKPASKVRVTFYESEKPLVVTSPEPSEIDSLTASSHDLLMASPMTDATMPPGFDRQMSTESGRDNPFRPDGDISREADEIVQLIKSGRPLLASSPRASDTPDGTLVSPDSKDTVSEPLISPQITDISHTSPPSSPKQTNDVQDLKPPVSPGLVGSNGSAAPNDTNK
ncbi:unnamed protein product, partial [Meganyctiphanes norvegica]